MRLARLPFAGKRDISEALLIPQVFERCHHICLKVVPFQEILLLITVRHDDSLFGDYDLLNLRKKPLEDNIWPLIDNSRQSQNAKVRKGFLQF